MFGLLVMTGKVESSSSLVGIGSGSGSDGRRIQFEFGSKSVQLVAHTGKEVSRGDGERSSSSVKVPTQVETSQSSVQVPSKLKLRSSPSRSQVNFHLFFQVGSCSSSFRARRFVWWGGFEFSSNTMYYFLGGGKSNSVIETQP